MKREYLKKGFIVIVFLMREIFIFCIINRRGKFKFKFNLFVFILVEYNLVN